MTMQASISAVLKSIYMALSVFLASPLSAAGEIDTGASEERTNKAQTGKASAGIGTRLTVAICAHPLEKVKVY